MSCSTDVAEASTGENEEKIMPKRRPVRRAEKGICQRCQVNKTLYIVRTLAHCGTCFQSAVFSRFARLLYPPLRRAARSRSEMFNLTRPAKQPGNVLIALSGGAGSLAMLDLMLHDGQIGLAGYTPGRVADLSKGEKEVIWEQGTVVYVEFSGVVGGIDRMEEMRGLVEGRQLGFVGLRAEDVYDTGLEKRLLGRSLSEPSSSGRTASVDLSRLNLPISSSSTTPQFSPLESLRTLLASLPPPSRPALLSNIVSHLLTLAAQSLPNISHLALGETSSRQAERIISATASGRGWALPLELSGSYRLPLLLTPGETTSSVTRLKPMREITIKEAAIYCHLKGLSTKTVNARGWAVVNEGEKRDARGKDGIASLEMLTEQFIAGLGVTHPSTVSTINRTGDKLVFAGSTSAPLCPLCQSPVDSSALEWKSRTALTSLAQEHNAAGIVDRHNTLAPLLCYACLTTLTPMRTKVGPEAETPVRLPLWVGDRIAQRKAVSQESMKAEIGEFLLEGGEEE